MNHLALNFGGHAINIPSGVPQGGLPYMALLLSNMITIFIVIGALFLVIYIVWAAIQWITSGGDKQKLATARGRLTWAIIGFSLLLASVGIINLVGFFFKVNLLRLS